MPIEGRPKEFSHSAQAFGELPEPLRFPSTVRDRTRGDGATVFPVHAGELLHRAVKREIENGLSRLLGAASETAAHIPEGAHERSRLLEPDLRVHKPRIYRKGAEASLLARTVFVILAPLLPPGEQMTIRSGSVFSL